MSRMRGSQLKRGDTHEHVEAVTHTRTHTPGHTHMVTHTPGHTHEHVEAVTHTRKKRNRGKRKEVIYWLAIRFFRG